MANSNQHNDIIDKAVAEGGAYEIIRQRLLKQGESFESKVAELNVARQEEFGSTEMKVLSRMRLRTENNCQAKDLVIVGNYILFGYNVFIGLKKDTKIEDVLSLYQLRKTDQDYELKVVSSENSFLSDQKFVTDFTELYAYYKNTRLSQLVYKDGKLLASFQIGEKLTDIRVFRWQVSANGESIDYIDNRGERDIRLPQSQDFEWTECIRDDVVDGRNPHINIIDTLFVDSLRGDITIKVENNTDSGLGIYSEPVLEKNQSLDDAEFYFCDLEQLILLKIRPYQEEQYRYLVFNKINQGIQRIDAIGDACQQLPEGHGIIFPGGYYLTSGEYKTFDDSLTGLVYKRTMRAPNGEDVLYVFYQPDSNVIALYPYNLINKSLQNPLSGHGYGFYEDGRMIIFYADEEPNRVHPIQMWQTPYFSDVYASTQPTSQSFYGKIGNADLVRGISELYAISKSIVSTEVSSNHYNELSKRCSKLFDSYYWLEAPELVSIAELIRQIAGTAEAVIDEYDKVESIRRESDKALSDSTARQEELYRQVDPESWHSPQDYVDALNKIRLHRGHLTTIRQYRYIDTEQIDQLDVKIEQVEVGLNRQTIEFLSSDEALKSYYAELETIASKSIKVKSNIELKPLVQAIDKIAQGLDLISQMLATLKVEDATQQTSIVDKVSELYGRVNQQKAEIEHQRKSFGSKEANAQFSARIKLLNQSIHNALSGATNIEKCDEQSARLIIQLEELEGEFGEYDEFINDIINKREEIFEAFETHKQSLLDAQQRKAQSLSDAGNRIIKSIQRRVKSLSEQDELNTFFASDALVNKLHEIIDQLNLSNDTVSAEDFDARLKSVKAQSVRALRDKSDLYEQGGQVIKLGPKHKFSVNRQELDLTLLPKDDGLFVRLTGTDYSELIVDKQLSQLSEFWSMALPSESSHLYRAEYLAYSILRAAQLNQSSLSWKELAVASVKQELLIELVSGFASTLYRDGYEKGIHDHDAALILSRLVSVYDSAGVFKYSPLVRGFGCIYWANCKDYSTQKLWHHRAINARQMLSVFSDSKARQLLCDEIKIELAEFNKKYHFHFGDFLLTYTSEYLAEELSNDHISFSTTKYARRLHDEFKVHLETHDIWNDYQRALADIKGDVGRRWNIAESWLNAYVETQSKPELKSFVAETIGILNAEQRVSRHDREIDIQFTIENLLGTHERVVNRRLDIRLDDFLERSRNHIEQIIPRYEKYLLLRQQVINQQKVDLRLEEFKPKPLTSFVRNRLINEVYLPLIGDNLAKQMGTVGAKKRTDLMGLLLMISPPGYGKTTLMEYVADRLGLIFMKINCPVIGHSVNSVDPEQADNSASRQELEKLNLALEMGNNVMLYLDDIQHTNSEFLQKFISLCDGTRRIEGVWKKRTKTYDMRGKKFCVVMAGNPYTESGESFQVPDMLANRADIYNLGDVLSGKESVFELSYLENALTSNPVLAPLATRDMKDVYLFIEMANGSNIASTDLSHQYASAEIKEIVAVLQKMQMIQKVVWKVNKAYISASAQDDKYRTEPTFKLQGSYRNMNKMSEKISAIMSDEELNRLVDDHYQGESQLLTNGTEANLLKLAEIRGTLTTEQSSRWQQIKSDYKRNKSLGGDDSDTGKKIVMQLNDLVLGVNDWRQMSKQHAQEKTNSKAASMSESSALKENNLVRVITAIENISAELGQVNKLSASSERFYELEKLSDMLEGTLKPLVKVMAGKLDLDLKTHKKMAEINEKIESMRLISDEVNERRDMFGDIQSVSAKKNPEDE